MCGIFCGFSEGNASTSYLYEHHSDCKHKLNRRGPDFQNEVQTMVDTFHLIFAASVLWLQGNQITEQPLETEDSIFVYNGDVFNFTETLCEIDPKKGDTKALMKFIEATDVFHTFSVIQGPFAFIYLDKELCKLYFGRDHFGRRSLLLGKRKNAYVIASVTKRNPEWEYIELPAIGIFCFDLVSGTMQLTPWKQRNENFKSKLEEVEAFFNLVIDVQNDSDNMSKMGYNIPQCDSFNIFRVIDTSNFVKTIKNLLSIETWFSKVSDLERILSRAVEQRVLIQPKFCNNCNSKRTCDHLSTGILFSGGVDCAILALLTSKYISREQPIDLLNVAFSKTSDFNTPDRLTGLNTFEELKQLCPDRRWNFVDINVSEEELKKERAEHIADLIFPLKTIMDDSLGCALWFASRGENSTYRSSCRVVLVGMGADELFGGYTKHRNSLKRGGWLGLYKSLEEDWQNLPHRNLARDDRVVSDHGRQLRTPYLDENVVDFVRNLNCWERTYPTEEAPQGLGEKILLRSLAYKLGLKKAAFLKKRALQFGSRIANSKENANDVSPRL